MRKVRNVYKSSALKFVLSGFMLLLANHSIAVTKNWTGGTSTDWNTGGNWSPSGVPASTDDVCIGVNIAFTRQPTLGTGPTSVTINSLTFGPSYGSTATLTVNSTYALTVTNSIAVSPSTIDFGTFVATLAGNGSITCQSVQVGNLTTFPTGLLVLFSNLIQLTSTINSFHITGNVSVNSTCFGILIGLLLNNSAFSLQGGTTVIDGTILTANASGGILNLGAAVATFSVDIPTSSSPVLQLTNTAPINTSSITGSIDFYNNTGGTGTSTVNYNYSGGSTQTVYTNNTASLDNTPKTYQYLQLTGTGTKTPNGGSLLINNDFTTSSSAVNLNTNNPTVSVGNNWTNTATVNQGSGDITVGGSLTNNSGGTLNLGTANLSIAGNYANNLGGVYTQSTGTTNFNGTTQTLTDASTTGTLFNNVTFSNSGTKTISSGSFGVSTTGVLNVLGSSTVLAPGGNLTMYASSSSPLAYAQIGPLTGTISGNVNYQVFFTGGAGYRNYRSMASPVYNNTTTYSSTNGTYTLASLKTSFIITGSGGITNGFDASSNNGATIRTYNVATNTYTFITSLNTAPVVASGTAFYMYFRGSRTPAGTVTLADPFGSKTNRTDGGGLYATADPVMYTYTGVPNQGSLAAPTFAATDVRFYYLANPYAATLDANAMINSTLSGGTYYVNTKTWIWSPSAANYAIYNFTTPALSVNGAKQYIVPGQGFFVQANTTGTAKTLTITESMKSVTNNSNAARFLYQAEPLAVADPPIFRLKFVKDSVLSDEIAVAFIDSAKATLDGSDAIHLEGSNLTLSSFTADNQYLAIDVRPFTGNKTTMQLYITPEQDTTYTLKLSYKNAAINNYKISLKDSLLNTTTDISNNAYSFSVVSAQANTYAKRFKLIIEPKPVPPTFAAFTGKLDAVKKVSLQWNSVGPPVNINYQVQRSTDKKTFINIGTPVSASASNPEISYQTLDPNPQIGLNYYRLAQTDMFNNSVYSDTVAVPFNPGLLTGIAKNGFVLYSNPVKDVVSIVSDKSYQGTVKLQIYNNQGQVQASQSYTGMDAQVAIQENVSNLRYGVYTAHIENNNKEMVVIKFIKQ